MVKGLLKVMCASVALFGGWVSAEVTLNGSGASFPKPMYDKFILEYNRIKPDTKINYTSVGSGAGIKAISEGITDFGASDSPMTDAQLAKATGGEIVHIPTVLGAVVPVYNVENLSAPVKFTGPVLADIFLGKITKWNDAKIAEINPGVTLPDQAITVVHRADGSGTTAIFTDYLSKVSTDWATGPGKGNTVKWPAPGAIAGKGNEQVAANVQKTPGAIGYVELIYAVANKIPFGSVKNKAGNFVLADMESVSAAAGNMQNVPADLRISLTDADGATAYPISGMTWLLIYKNQKDAAKGKALVEFVQWVTHDGQSLAPALHYAPLPKSLIPLVEKNIEAISAK